MVDGATTHIVPPGALTPWEGGTLSHTLPHSSLSYRTHVHGHSGEPGVLCPSFHTLHTHCLHTHEYAHSHTHTHQHNHVHTHTGVRTLVAHSGSKCFPGPGSRLTHTYTAHYTHTRTPNSRHSSASNGVCTRLVWPTLSCTYCLQVTM